MLIGRRMRRLTAESAVQPAHTINRPSHLTNMALLIAGLSGGQGMIFAVQSLLVAQGRLDLLSAFGTHYSFAMLGIIVTDGGTSTILARDMARRAGGQSTTEDLRRSFTEAIAFRLAMVALMAIAAAVYVMMMEPSAFSRAYVLCALPGLLFWASNVAGLLDGLGRSGVSGISSALANAASAAALAFARVIPPEQAGWLLGSAFSAGYFATVLTQWIALRRCGWMIGISRVAPDGLARAFKNGTAMLFQLLPGQLLLRAQLALSATYLGHEMTAVFTYVRQIIAALTMIVAVILRVDFPGLVERTSRRSELHLSTAFAAQKMSLHAAIALAAGAVIVSSLSYLVPQNRFSAAGQTLLIFAPTILTISLSLLMAQAMLALGQYTRLAAITAAACTVGTAISYLLVSYANLYAFLIGELAFHFFGFVFMRQSIEHPGKRLIDL